MTRPPEALFAACDAAISCYEQGGAAWEALVDAGMAVDFDWVTSSAPRYVDAYERAVADPPGAG